MFHSKNRLIHINLLDSNKRGHNMSFQKVLVLFLFLSTRIGFHASMLKTTLLQHYSSHFASNC